MTPKVMRAKVARMVLRYAKAWPLLSVKVRENVQGEALDWLARGYTPTPTELCNAVDWSKVDDALWALALTPVSESKLDYVAARQAA